MSPAPSFRHQVITRNVFLLLHAYLQRNPRGEVYFAPLDVFLSESDVVQPDVFLITSESHHLIREDGVHGAPELVVEIVSPGSAQLDKKRKPTVYARHGVKEFWLVDPVLEQIHRYDFAIDAAKPVRIVDSEETFESPVLPGLLVSAGDVFKR